MLRTVVVSFGVAISFKVFSRLNVLAIDLKDLHKTLYCFKETVPMMILLPLQFLSANCRGKDTFFFGGFLTRHFWIDLSLVFNDVIKVFTRFAVSF